MTALLSALSFAMAPCAAMLVAGAIALSRRPSPALQSLLQHFAAGVVLSAAAGEILPEVRASQSALELTLGFGGGVLAMLGIGHVTDSLGGEEKDETPSEEGTRKSPTAMLAAVAVDIFLDGALIGLGFASGARAGLLLTVALTLELVFLGLTTTGSLVRAGVSRRKVFSHSSGYALCSSSAP